MFSPSRTIVSSSPSVAMILVHTFNLSSKIETIPNPHPKELKEKNEINEMIEKIKYTKINYHPFSSGS